MASSSSFLFAVGTLLLILAAQASEAYLFIRGVRLSRGWATALVALFVVANLPLPYVAWLIAGARQPSALVAALVVRPFFAWQFNWLGFLMFVAPLLWLVRGVGWWAGTERLVEGSGWLVLALAVVWGVISALGLYHTLKPPELTRLELKLPGLPRELQGLKIAQLSDPHVAWWNSRAEIERIGRMIAEAEPDLLLITGDMVDHHPDYVYTFADALEPVQPRFGRYAVIGNHDVYTGREAVARRMTERGFVMLRDGHVRLSDLGPPLILAGVEDSGMSWTGRDPAMDKLPEVLAGLTGSETVILLAHRPSAFDNTQGLPVDLVLSGHTHGGQFRLPLGGPGLADFTFHYSQGLYRRDGQTLYVSRGTGTVGWPFRLFCPPEVTIFTLKSSEEREAGSESGRKEHGRDAHVPID